MGYVSAERAQLLARHLPHTQLQADRIDWDADHLGVAGRSEVLQGVLLKLRDAGHLPGWRDEIFSLSEADSDRPFLLAERAGFYFLGMRSDAVHVNGLTADGQMWIARRSTHKAVDPGLFDNLCAGGLGAAAKKPAHAVVRELYEEAGLHLCARHSLQHACDVKVGRVRAGGWHEERLQVYNMVLAPAETTHQPRWRGARFPADGCRGNCPPHGGWAITPDAAAAISQGVLTAG
jgi:hypothetical protein